MTQEEWNKEQEETPKHAVLLGMMCFGVIAGAFCVMKSISEHARDKKLSWKEFLFPKQQ